MTPVKACKLRPLRCPDLPEDVRQKIANLVGDIVVSDYDQLALWFVDLPLPLMIRFKPGEEFFQNSNRSSWDDEQNRTISVVKLSVAPVRLANLLQKSQAPKLLTLDFCMRFNEDLEADGVDSAFFQALADAQGTLVTGLQNLSLDVRLDKVSHALNFSRMWQLCNSIKIKFPPFRMVHMDVPSMQELFRIFAKCTSLVRLVVLSRDEVAHDDTGSWDGLRDVAKLKSLCFLELSFKINKNCMEPLVSGLKKSKSLKHVRLDCLSVDSAVLLAKYLKHNTILESLWCGKPLRSSNLGTLAIMQSIRQNSSLKSLHLTGAFTSGSFPSTEGEDSILKDLACSDSSLVKPLEKMHCEFSFNAMPHALKFVQCWQGWTSICLSIHDDKKKIPDVSEVFRTLCRCTSLVKLEVCFALDLYRCKKPEAIDGLSHLANLKNLRFLKIDLDVYECTMEILITVLAKNSTIKHLHINGISPEAGVLLAKHLENDTVLQSVSCEESYWYRRFALYSREEANEGMVAIMDSMRRNCSIKSLNISGTARYSGLVSMLEENTTLTDLTYLDEARIFELHAPEIATAIAKNRSLRKLKCYYVDDEHTDKIIQEIRRHGIQKNVSFTYEAI